jgi:tetratricopeptide (TPR) repeat protein
MACTEERRAQVGALAAGRLDAAASAELLDHLEGCAACSGELDLAAELVAGHAREGAGFFAPRRARPSGARPTTRRLLWPAAAAAGVALCLWLIDGGGSPLRPEELAQVEPLPAVTTLVRADVAERGNDWSTAMERYAAGEWALAAGELTEFAAAHPDDALSRLYLGISALQNEDPERAARALDECVERADDLVLERALWYLAHAQLARGEVDAARTALERLAKLDGDYLPNARAKLEALRTLATE